MQVSRQDYAGIDKQAGGVQLDLKPLKQTAQQILQDTNFVRKSAASLDQRALTKILEDMSSLPNGGTFSNAQQVRSALLDASRIPELAISTRAQGALKQLTGSIDSEMMNAAYSKPGLSSSFRLANEHWERLQEGFNDPRSPLAQILREPDPNLVPQKLTQKGQIGGSPYRAELLDRYRIDKSPVKRVIAEDLFQKNFGLYNGGKSLGGYSDPFLQSIFSPQELGELYKTGAIARSVGLNVNPSGTAGAMNAIEDATHPKRAFFKAVPAWATKSPGFNQWMLNPPAQSGSLAARVGQGIGRALNPRPQVRPLPLSSLLGPAVAGRGDDDRQ